MCISWEYRLPTWILISYNIINFFSTFKFKNIVQNLFCKNIQKCVAENINKNWIATVKENVIFKDSKSYFYLDCGQEIGFFKQVYFYPFSPAIFELAFMQLMEGALMLCHRTRQQLHFEKVDFNRNILSLMKT